MITNLFRSKFIERLISDGRDIIKNLFRRKSIDLLLSDGHDSKLKRALSAFNLVSLGVGAIIGTGIFVLTGTAAALYAGPAVVFSFLLSGLGCVFAGLCYSEFASMIPIAGSAYTYSYATLGEFIAWIIGWDLILEYLFASSTVAVGWSGYFVSFLKEFKIIIPDSLSQSPFTYDIANHSWDLSGAYFNFPAMVIILLVTTLLVVGVKESAKFNNSMVIVKLAVILLFIGFGIQYINTDNWTPFIPAETADGHFGISGIFTGAAVIFFAYIGFDAVSTTAQEAKNPQRDMPIGMLVSLLICTVLYVAVSAVLTGIVPYTELNVSAPIALAIDRMGEGMGWLRMFVKIGAIAGLSSVMLVLLMGQPRIFFAMSKDGLLPKSFSSVHKRFKTPYITTIITGGAAAIIAGALPINILGELVSIGTLFAFVIVCGGILFLRKTHPETPRPFRTPWVPFVPIAGIVICLSQMFSLPFDTWARLVLWMIIGIIIYFAYSYRRSNLNNNGTI
ncbi:MAG: amino acid permease [Breznakibacter sp.]|nr:amino acid permease [Breznakibacter sp.]